MDYALWELSWANMNMYLASIPEYKPAPAKEQEGKSEAAGALPTEKIEVNGDNLDLIDSLLGI